jgi:hypothetical protein
MLADVKQKTIGPLIKKTIAAGSVVYTDEYDIYHRLPEWGYPGFLTNGMASGCLICHRLVYHDQLRQRLRTAR